MEAHAARRAVVTEPGRVEIQPAEVPAPGPGQVVIRMRMVGICGSDVHAFHARHPFVSLPYSPGHEIFGVVEAVGPDVTGVTANARVVVEPILSCGDCKYCRDGRYNLCTTMSFFGCTTADGGLADYLVVPADRVVAVPDEVSDLAAVLVEPLSTPVHAVRLAGPDLTGRTVAILGAGTIGLLTLVAARHAGAARIAVSDLAPGKRELARALGADSVHDAASASMVQDIRDDLGTSADIVFDCVAVQSSVDQAIAIALKGGTVMIVGVPAAPVTVPLPEIQDLQVRVQGSATYTRDDIENAVALLAAGAVDPERIITARYPLAEIDEAFAAACSGRHVKVVVTA
ncbi:alcohol dehydrogenase catalytic domain-containing protein [Actinoplanes bogorensis]|uniref:Alcohol dehydrogenase catalytic domain-containing protein n=1 Tax=Paractinoplanes bogorensis TaxID=1610840 RepID=A0ABS5Z752_9ACTN|nr:alcohol dehydrogenase catalytic domain-containing protein [Actinoplanes bogorensis]MBU2670305.1 alcohol dehydrogenase catalytic domain-containing protein [Actinoplanes bogorensis]